MSFLRVATATIAGFLVPLSSNLAGGGCFSSCFSQKVVQAVVAPQPISYTYYFVGQPIREQALVQKAVQDDPLWKEFQEFKRWKESGSVDGDQRGPLGLTGSSTVNPPSTALSRNCLKCHSGEEPKGDLSLEGELPLETRHKMLTMIWSGKMPPTGPLPNEEAAELFNELLLEGDSE